MGVISSEEFKLVLKQLVSMLQEGKKDEVIKMLESSCNSVEGRKNMINLAKSSETA